MRGQHKYYVLRKKVVSREKIVEIIFTMQQNKVLTEVLEQYDLHAEDLTLTNPSDLDVYLDHRKSDYEKFQLLSLLGKTRGITISGMTLPGREKTTVVGPRDGINYLIGKLQEGVLLTD